MKPSSISDPLPASSRRPLTRSQNHGGRGRASASRFACSKLDLERHRSSRLLESIAQSNQQSTLSTAPQHYNPTASSAAASFLSRIAVELDNSRSMARGTPNRGRGGRGGAFDSPGTPRGGRGGGRGRGGRGRGGGVASQDFSGVSLDYNALSEAALGMLSSLAS